MLRTFVQPSRMLAMMTSAALLAGATGTDCSFSGVVPIPVDDTVEIELINLTPFEVDPRLEISEDVVAIDPPLEPDEVFPFETDCFEGDVISTDALMFVSDADAVLSENVPFVEEGLDFLCGDTVTFVFFIDAESELFFTDVEVNGQIVTDCDGCLP